MKTYLATTLIALCVAVSCSKPGDKTVTKDSHDPSRNGKTKGVAAVPDPPDRLQGKIVMSSSAPEEKCEDASLDIQIDKNERISGNISMGETTLAVTGFRENGSLRCWVSSENAVLENARQGVLFARSEGKKVTGTLTVSGNGGKPVEHGTVTGTFK